MASAATEFNEIRQGAKGKWISVEEAKKRTVGREEWWKTKGIGGRTVELKQHDPTGPRDKPIWLFESGGMYLGEWKSSGPDGYPVMHGFGIVYRNKQKHKGRVFIGHWRDGKPHGPGKEFWLESSPFWRKNEWSGSRIKEQVNGIRVGRPHVYEGHIVDGKRHDPRAKVTLKDGTCRVGPWEYGKPVGSWWYHDHHPRVATVAAASSASQQEETEERRPAKRARSELAEQEEDSKPAAREAEQAQNGANEGSSDNDNLMVQPGASPSSSVDLVASGEGNDLVQTISNWLTETIGHNPARETIQNYAHTLFSLGFESVEMMTHECTAQDLDSYEWIKPIHKRILKRKLDRVEE